MNQTFPTLDYETYWRQRGKQVIAGVDEVGRGCLAGPVVAAAVVFDPGVVPVAGVADSKQLSPATRQALIPAILNQARDWGIGISSRQEIDEQGILIATFNAMKRAVTELGQVNHVLIDGRDHHHLKANWQNYQAIVKGDAVCYSIAAASIVAKEFRDALMRRLHRDYPAYGWDRNKGYGSAYHRLQIRAQGVTEWHRLSFLK